MSPGLDLTSRAPLSSHLSASLDPQGRLDFLSVAGIRMRRSNERGRAARRQAFVRCADAQTGFPDLRARTASPRAWPDRDPTCRLPANSGTARTKWILKALMRLEKASSPSGWIMRPCTCSGSTTQPSIANGRSRRVRRTASRGTSCAAPERPSDARVGSQCSSTSRPHGQFRASGGWDSGRYRLEGGLTAA